MTLRIVLDTNIIISSALKPSSQMAQMTYAVMRHATLLTSQDVYDELSRVMQRFVDKGYVDAEDRVEFLARYVECVQWVAILRRVTACRDNADDKMLELAVNGDADMLVTGDKDLLVLHPFEKTHILTPAQCIDTLPFLHSCR